MTGQKQRGAAQKTVPARRIPLSPKGVVAAAAGLLAT